MKKVGIMAVAVMIVGSGLALRAARPQMAGVKRTDLQRHDLSVPGHEVVQARVEIEPGVTAPRHSHPGEEIIYVLAGSLEYQIDGQPTKVRHAGEALTFRPASSTRCATSAPAPAPH